MWALCRHFAATQKKKGLSISAKSLFYLVEAALVEPTSLTH
jgi:hypothetical protein